MRKNCIRNFLYYFICFVSLCLSVHLCGPILKVWFSFVANSHVNFCWSVLSSLIYEFYCGPTMRFMYVLASLNNFFVSFVNFKLPFFFFFQKLWFLFFMIFLFYLLLIFFYAIFFCNVFNKSCLVFVFLYVFCTSVF